MDDRSNVIGKTLNKINEYNDNKIAKPSKNTKK